MSFFRHREIFPNDPGATLSDYSRAHRPDESPVGYSSAGCSPASPASALPTRFAVCAKLVLLVDGFSSNGELCLNCLSHSRGQAQVKGSKLVWRGVH
jgi:hypothetical protein